MTQVQRLSIIEVSEQFHYYHPMRFTKTLHSILLYSPIALRFKLQASMIPIFGARTFPPGSNDLKATIFTIPTRSEFSLFVASSSTVNAPTTTYTFWMDIVVHVSEVVYSHWAQVDLEASLSVP